MDERESLAQPLVGIVVITWNGRHAVRRCLRSLQRIDYPRYRICVVDNGSLPELVSGLKAEFPGVDTVRVEENRGYAAGCNAGLAWAKREGAHHALLLNDDTTVDAALLQHLVGRCQERSNRAIVAPLILEMRLPGVIWSAGGRIRMPWFKADHIGFGETDTGTKDVRHVEWASGCALLVPMQVLDSIGPLDERYFLYLEDVDWCLRARSQGFDIVMEPRARVWHEVSSSVSRIDERNVRYYAYRNYYLLAFSHSGPLGRIWFTLHLGATLFKIAVRQALFPAYRRSSWYHARTRAIFDFLRRRFGKAPYGTTPGKADALAATEAAT
jgi:GT2 family glycosyltransferase